MHVEGISVSHSTFRIPVAVDEVRKGGEIYLKGSFSVTDKLLEKNLLRLRIVCSLELKGDIFIGTSQTFIISEYFNDQSPPKKKEGEKEEKEEELDLLK